MIKLKITQYNGLHQLENDIHILFKGQLDNRVIELTIEGERPAVNFYKDIMKSESGWIVQQWLDDVTFGVPISYMSPMGIEVYVKIIKENKDNNRGLYGKYRIQKTNGNPINDDAEFFILRLDDNQKDKHHLHACIEAIKVYADLIEPFIPLLATDLRNKYKLV